MSSKRGVNTTVLGLGLLLVIPLLVLFAKSFGNDPHAIPSVLESKPAPTFRLTDLDGKTWSLDELKGRPVVINFWSTWCGPCKSEHGLLQASAQQNPDVTFLGIIYNDEPDACRRYLATAGTSYAHLVDDAGRTALDYGVGGVPETFFLGADGTVVRKHTGPLTPASMRALLAEVRR